MKGLDEDTSQMKINISKIIELDIELLNARQSLKYYLPALSFKGQ